MSPSNEPARLADQLERAYQGDAWHGDNVKTVLKDVTAAESAARPIPTSHTIGELVGHMSYWLNTVATRLEGKTWAEPSEVDNWPPTTADAGSWQSAQKAPDAAVARLGRILEKYPADGLYEPPARGSTSAYVQAHGAVQHTLYHLGQVALLKKAVRG